MTILSRIARISARDQGTNKIILDDSVMTDLDIIRALRERAKQVSSSEAIELLTRALGHVRGIPFDAPGYDWAHEHQHHARACDLIQDTALQLVDLALDTHDIAAARHAIAQGLRALPANEPLYRARMRLEAAIGKSAGVRAAYHEHTQLLDELADGDDAFEPSPRTRQLLDELLGATTARSA